MKKNILKFITKKVLLALLVTITSSAISQTITINPSDSNQAVTFGGDAKLTIKNYADGNTNTVSDKLFDEMKLKILRVPIFALQPITDDIYDDVITVINSVKAVQPNVKIFASIANGDGYGTHYHGSTKFPSSWRGCCSYNLYRLNLTAYAAYLDSFMAKMNSAGITIDYLGPWNEDNAGDTDHSKVFNQMNNLGSTKKVGLERWGLLTSIADVNDIEDQTDIIGSHFYDDTTIPEADWNSKWASLVSASSDPVWYTESTRYSTSDNISNLLAGLDNIFPAIRGGAESVIFYQACNRLVYANGGVPAIKYSGFKNIVNNAWGKVMNSYGNDSSLKVVTFGNNSKLNVHIINTGSSNKTVSINITNGYNVSGKVTRKIWTSSDTGKINSYTLNGNSTWNVSVNANSYCHLNIPLNKAVASKSSNSKEVVLSDNNLDLSEQSENVIIYPNPSKNGKFSLSLPLLKNLEKINIQIFNINGQEVYSETMNYSDSISLDSNLSVGMYFIKVKAGTNIFNKKLIINNN